MRIAFALMNATYEIMKYIRIANVLLLGCEKLAHPTMECWCWIRSVQQSYDQDPIHISM